MTHATIAGEPGHFRPRTVRQFLVFHIAYRFDELSSLHRYLNTCVSMSRSELLDCARRAEQRAYQDGSSPSANFWLCLTGGKEAA